MCPDPEASRHADWSESANWTARKIRSIEHRKAVILTVNKREDGGNWGESEAVSPGQADSTPGLLHSNTSNKTKNSYNLERFLQATHIKRVLTSPQYTR
jgi:hypothetical protein